MCAFSIGSIAYLREPENGQNCGVVISVGGVWLGSICQTTARFHFSITNCYNT